MPKWISTIIYVGFGLIIMPYLSELRTALDTDTIAYLLLGGAAYTIGALTYALRWPNPSPRFFGYHEIFHLLVVIGVLFHFILVNNIVNR